VHCKCFSNEAALFKLVAGCDTDPAKIEKLVSEYPCAGYGKPEEFLADPKVELAMICTRSTEHVAHALQALAAGKYVLLEKPIALDGDDIRKLRDADKRYPGRLFFLHNHRFEPAIEHIRRIIASGILGNIHLVKMCRHHTFRRRPDWQAIISCGGGQLNNWGSHVVDHALQFIGAPVKNVWSDLRRVNAVGDAENHVKVIIAGENGIIVDLEISDAVALPGPFCTVYGDRGSLICPDEKKIQLKYIEPGFQFSEVAASPGSPPLTGGFGHEETIPWRQETVAVEPAGPMYVLVEVAIARHLYRALREGVPFPIANADALEVSRIIGLVKEQNPQFKFKR
jgi:predicted dehydrogenase